MRDPDRISIREATLADVAGIAEVHVDSWRTTYEGIISSHVLARLSHSRRESLWREILSAPPPSTLTLVAVDAGDRVVGFANAGPGREPMEEYVGELYAIYILQDYQGRGVGTALMRGAVEHLLANGMGTMYVWVLSANPSRLFYEALGGTPIGTKTVDIGGRLLEETAYGWSDIAPLAMQ